MRPGAASGPADRLIGSGHHFFGRWRVLLGFWAGLLTFTGGVAGLLAWLGPPEPRVKEAASAAGPAVVPGAESLPAMVTAVQAGTASGRPTESPPMPSAAVPGSVSAPLAAIPPVAIPAESPADSLAVAALGPPPAPQPPPLDAVAAAFRPATAADARPIAPPDPALLEPGAHGPLPQIGPEGRSAIRTYGRAFDRTDPRPRLGLVIGGLGMNASLTEQAIRRLPGAVTLAFSPYARQVGPLLDQARARGMELLVALPLEPTGHPTLNNAGDRALLTGLRPTENLDRLDWVLSRFAGYVGAIGALGPMRGERFAQANEAIGAVQDQLRGRGLLYLDPRPEPRAGVGGAGSGPRAVERAWGRAIDIVVDEPATRGEIELKLAALERLARERGPAGALGYAGEASPVLVDRVASWAAGVEARGFVLAPVTAMIRRPEAATIRGPEAVAAEAVPQAARARPP